MNFKIIGAQIFVELRTIPKQFELIFIALTHE